MMQNNENSAKGEEICQNFRPFGVKMLVELTRRGIREIAKFDY
jgi:hypothetical protein